MLARTVSASTGLTKQASSEPLKLPGLVSALRPIKRGSSQLSEEASLLRRFTYKNKNQHKGCGWWRKIVEVDRMIERVGTELQALLGEFGIDKEKDGIGTIDQQAVVKGLMRLPRSMLIVEKVIEVMLGSASILEQLIHSRAFLSFALVVVALIARLHTLATVLLDDLGKVSAVLVKLVHANSLLSQVEPPYQQLPRNLKRFINLRPDLTSSLPPSIASSLAPSAVPTPLARSPEPSALEDYGAKISREEMLARRSGGKRSIAPEPIPRSDELKDVAMVAGPTGAASSNTSRLNEPLFIPSASSPAPSLPVVERRTSPLIDLAASPIPRKIKPEKDRKRRLLKEGGTTAAAAGGSDAEVKRKKKRRVKAKDEEEDEIDSIFG